MSAPLHVGWLVWGDEQGGVASAVINNIALATSLGQTVSLWSFGPGCFADTARARGFTVHWLGESAERHRRYIAHGFSPLGVLRRGAVVLAMRKVLRAAFQARPQPDVLCLPWADLMPLAGPVAKDFGIGLVMEIPSAPSRYRFDLNQRIYTWMVRRWRVRILANSAFTASRLALVPGVAVMTPAVDTARFDPALVQPLSRTALGVPAQALVVGLIARLDPAKGADIAIAALAQLAEEVPELHLLLVGGPLNTAYAESLREQVKQAGLTARVHWANAVTNPERYWTACDLALNAYKGAEAFGLSIVEAMLMQRPVLAHSLGQPGNTLEDGRSGWLFSEPTAAAIAQGLRRALAAREQWPRMGQCARNEALRRFAGPTHGERYLKLLREQAERAHHIPP